MLKMLTTPSRGAVAAALAAAALLASGTAAAELKVGTIRVEELFVQSPQFKAGQEKMKAEFDKRQKDLEAEAKKFQADVEKFQKEKDTLLSPTARAEQEKNLSSRQVDLNYKGKQLQEDVQNLDRKLLQEAQVKIKTVIDQIAKEKGLDLVVRDPVYAAPGLDITADVLKALGGTAAPAAAAAADKKKK